MSNRLKIFIKNCLKAILPAGVQSHLKKRLRRLKIISSNQMEQVLMELEKRKVRLKDLHALEVFGYDGTWHTTSYAFLVSTLEVWEIEQKHLEALQRNLPMAKVKITDSYEEIKNTSGKYSLIIVDNPMSTYSNYCEHFELFPDIFRVATDLTILILNVIPEIDEPALKKYPYLFNDLQLEHRQSFYGTTCPEKVSFDEMVEAYKNLITANGFNLEWYFFQRRGSIVYYLVLKIVR